MKFQVEAKRKSRPVKQGPPCLHAEVTKEFETRVWAAATEAGVTRAEFIRQAVAFALDNLED